MVGKASLYVIIGFSIIFAIAGQYWNRSTVSGIANFVDYYNNSASHNLAVIGANLAIDSVKASQGKDTSLTFLFHDGIDTCIVTAHQKITGALRDCFIQSISYYNDAPTQIRDTVKVMLQPVVFSGFAFFSNSENNVQWGSNDVVNGPLHTEDYLYINGSPTFNGRVTTVKGISSSNNQAHFNGGYQAGSATSIKMPTDFTLAENAAQTNGKLLINSNGSSYTYDVYLKFTSDGKVSYKDSLKSGGVLQTPSSGPGSQLDWSTASLLTTFTPNGIIAVKNGDIHIIGGSVVNGQVTVLAEQGASKSSTVKYAGSYFSSSVDGNVIVEGSVTYNDNPNNDPNFLTNSTDMLGLVADNCVALNNQKTKIDITVDAAIFARQKSWTYLDYDGTLSGYYNPNGASNVPTLTMYGSITQNIRGAVATGSNGIATTGYNKNYSFDKRFLNISPPFYPAAINQFSLLSWYESN